MWGILLSLSESSKGCNILVWKKKRLLTVRIEREAILGFSTPQGGIQLVVPRYTGRELPSPILLWDQKTNVGMNKTP